MIKKLICLIWGHKVWHKTYSGKTIRRITLSGCEVDSLLYSMQYNTICPRCSKRLMGEDNDQKSDIEIR